MSALFPNTAGPVFNRQQTRRAIIESAGENDSNDTRPGGTSGAAKQPRPQMADVHSQTGHARVERIPFQSSYGGRVGPNKYGRGVLVPHQQDAAGG
jgi:hypothetical protein